VPPAPVSIRGSRSCVSAALRCSAPLARASRKRSGSVRPIVQRRGIEVGAVRPNERREEIATLTLKRPAALNAHAGESMPRLARALLDLQGDDSIGAVIATGAGRAFCAGMDRVELGSGSGGERSNPPHMGRRIRHHRTS
jgi:hypothetical protein